MEVSDKAVERLALEWVKEATRLRGLAVCACRCGKPIKPRAFIQGHDAKLRSDYAAKIRSILSGRPA